MRSTRSKWNNGAQGALRWIGLEVRRSSRDRPVPLLLEDPLRAMHRNRGGEPTAYLCPTSLLRTPNAFGLAAGGWHPMTAALSEHASSGIVDYSQSVLRTYYEGWQPRNALEAIAGFTAHDANALLTLPSHMFLLQPWVSFSPAVLDRKIRDYHRDDAREHGVSGRLTLEGDGLGRHGPVSDVVGRMELARLVSVHESIRRSGFDRTRGDVTCKILKRGSDKRFLLQGPGYHRTVAMCALGVEHVPARFPSGEPDMVDVDDVDLWPQVVAGTWSRDDARRYVDHLFDFDERTWAVRRGLARD